MSGFLEIALLLTAPILLAATGELLLERSGTIQIGIEGTMLAGAFAAFAVGLHGGPGAGLLAAGAIGLLGGGLFALFAVGMRADPILVGTAWNLLAAGGTAFGYQLLAGETGAVLELPSLPPILFGLPWPALAAFLLPFLVDAFFRFSRPGLLVTAAGETPEAVRAAGVSVVRVRSAASLIAGLLGGAGGGLLVLSISHTFVEGVTAGRGFLALAVVVFTRWRPLLLVPGALLVGGATALQYRLQAAGGASLPYALFLALPPLLALAAMTLSAGRGGAPKAMGSPAP